MRPNPVANINIMVLKKYTVFFIMRNSPLSGFAYLLHLAFYKIYSKGVITYGVRGVITSVDWIVADFNLYQSGEKST